MTRDRSTSPGQSKCLHWKVCLLLMLISFTAPLWGQSSSIEINGTEVAPELIKLETEEPEGFEDLKAERETQLTLYVDGQSLGPIDVQIAPGTVRFINPSVLFALLPPLRDPAAVNSALKTPLESNAGLSCTPSPLPGCGRLQPDVIGVILSRDAGRIDLFLADETRGEARRNLPIPPPGPPTVAGALGLQYSLSQSRIEFTLQPRILIGLGRSHFSADATFSKNYSSLDRAFFRKIGNRSSVSIGLISSSPFNFAYFDRLAGIRFGSSNETRIERGSIADTPIFLESPLNGRVEILRDGVLLDTQRVSAGRAIIDTSALPGGAYPLTLNIIDATGERTETRFFVRAPGLPGFGETEYFVEGGWNTAFRSTNSNFLPAVLSPTLRSGINYRAGPQLGLSARGEITEKRRLAEFGLTYLQSGWRMSATVGLTDSGQYAEAFSASGNFARFNWSIDARAVQGESSLIDRDSERGLGRTYEQLSVFAGYSHQRFNLNTGIIWRHDQQGKASFTLLPSARWIISQRNGRRWSLDTSGSYSSSGWSIRAGIQLSFSTGRNSISASVGTEGRSSDGSTRFRPVASADLSRNLETSLGPLQLRAGVNHQSDRWSGRLGANLTTTYAQLNADAQIEQELARSSLYGRVETVFGFADGRLAFGSGGYTGAGIVAEAKGAEKDASFTVRALGSNGRPISGSRPVFVPTTPFSQSEIGFNSVGGSSSFDTRNEPATFYPGTVKRLVRKANRVTIIFARLLDRKGMPIGSAWVESNNSIAETDATGSVQIEVQNGATLKVEQQDNSLCYVKLPALNKNSVFVDFGELVCLPEDL